MLKIKPVVLMGQWVRLEPLGDEHKSDLYHAAQDNLVWTETSSQTYEERFTQWFNYAMRNQKNGEQLAFVVKRIADGKMIGSTRYYDINADHRRLAIGYTWYVPEVSSTYVNPECKFLLLKHAFDVLHANRVEFVTDSRNKRACAALIKLGAHEEGILRQNMILENGYIRDTAVFSIVKSEWPDVKADLEKRLNAFKKIFFQEKEKSYRF